MVLTASASRLPLYPCPAAGLGTPHLCSCSCRPCRPRSSPPHVSNQLCLLNGAVNALNRLKPPLLLYLGDRQPRGWSRVCTAEMAATGLGTWSFPLTWHGMTTRQPWGQPQPPPRVQLEAVRQYPAPQQESISTRHYWASMLSNAAASRHWTSVQNASAANSTARRLQPNTQPRRAAQRSSSPKFLAHGIDLARHKLTLANHAVFTLFAMSWPTLSRYCLSTQTRPSMRVDGQLAV